MYMVTRCGSVSRRPEMSAACSGTWTSCIAPPASTTSTITPSIVPYNHHRQIGPAPQALQMSVCRSWSAVEIDTAKTCHCETFRNLPRLTLQAPSPTFQFFPVPTTKLSTRLRLLGQVGNWLDLGKPATACPAMAERRVRQQQRVAPAAEQTSQARRPLTETQKIGMMLNIHLYQA